MSSLSKYIKVFSVIVLFMSALLSSCTNMTVDEFPENHRLENDFIAYTSELVDEEIDFYSLTITKRDYKELDKKVHYSCDVQYKWINEQEIYSDECVITYALKNGKWAYYLCESPVLLERAQRKIRMYNLFIDSDYVLKLSNDEDDIDLSRNLFDFTAEIEEVTYQFPCDFIDLTSDGWVISKESGFDVLDKIESESYGELEMVKGNSTINVYVFNLNEYPIQIGESHVGGFKANSNNCFVSLGRYITTESSATQIIDSFGTPVSDKDLDDGREISYSTDEFVRTTFLIGEDYSEIEMMNFFESEKQIEKASLFDTYNFNFALGEGYYALPCQLSLFIENGWSIKDTSKTEDKLRWYETRNVTLIKDDMSIDLFVENASLSKLNIESCLVTKIKLDSTSAEFDLINYKVDEEEIVSSEADSLEFLKFLGDPSDTKVENDIEVLYYTLDENKYLSAYFNDSNVVELNTTEGESFSLFDSFVFKAEIMDVVYEVPCSASKFKENGWEPEYGWDQIMMPGGWCELGLIKDGETIRVLLCNTEKEYFKLDSCSIGGINSRKGDVDILLDGEMGSGNSYDDVADTYGLPEINGGGESDFLLYKSSSNKMVSFSLEEGYVEEVWIISFMFSELLQ